MLFVPPVQPRYDKERIFERLHVEPGSAAWEYNDEIFPEIVAEVTGRLKMHGCFLLGEDRIVSGVEEIDRSAGRAVCMIAIEQNVMDRMDEYLADYDFPEAYLLDGLVNEILFNAGDDVCDAAAAAARERGWGLTRRYIPGDEPLDLSVQEKLLVCLDGAEEAAVLSMDARGVLRPDKAALYLFGADPSYLTDLP